MFIYNNSIAICTKLSVQCWVWSNHKYCSEKLINFVQTAYRSKQKYFWYKSTSCFFETPCIWWRNKSIPTCTFLLYNQDSICIYLHQYHHSANLWLCLFLPPLKSHTCMKVLCLPLLPTEMYTHASSAVLNGLSIWQSYFSFFPLMDSFLDDNLMDCSEIFQKLCHIFGRNSIVLWPSRGWGMIPATPIFF